MLTFSSLSRSVTALLLVACGSNLGSSAEHAPSQNVAIEEDADALDTGYAPHWNESPLNGVLVPVPIDEMERVELEHRGPAVTGRMRFEGRIVAVSARQPDTLGDVTGPATIAVHYDAAEDPAFVARVNALASEQPIGLYLPYDEGFDEIGFTGMRMLRTEIIPDDPKNEQALRELIVTGRGDLEGIRGLSLLERLEVSGLASNLDVLPTLTGLRALRIEADEPLPPLPESIERLTLEGLVSRADLETAAALPDLRVLTLAGELEDPLDLGVVATISSLRSLYVSRVPVTDDALAPIATLSRLQHLDVSHTEVTDAGLDVLRSLPRLRTLELEGVPVGDRGIEVIASLSRLERLSLGRSSSVHVPIFSEENPEHSSVDVSPLGQLRNLESLSLINIEVGDVALASFRGLARLRQLRLMGANITADGMASIADGLPNLIELSLSGTNVNDVRFVRELRRLRRLMVVLSPGMPASTLNTLAGHPELRSIQVGGGLVSVQADALLSMPHLRVVQTSTTERAPELEAALRRRTNGFDTHAVEALGLYHRAHR